MRLSLVVNNSIAPANNQLKLAPALSPFQEVMRSLPMLDELLVELGLLKEPSSNREMNNRKVRRHEDDIRITINRELDLVVHVSNGMLHQISWIKFAMRNNKRLVTMRFRRNHYQVVISDTFELQPFLKGKQFERAPRAYTPGEHIAVSAW